MKIPYPVSAYILTEMLGATLVHSVADRSVDSWRIEHCGATLNRNHQWEYQPLPSNRGVDYIKRTRFTLKEALVIWRAHIDWKHG